jgi:Protein phosphatase 2C
VWRHIAQSLQGPSHLDDGTPCQDAYGVSVSDDHSRSSLIACVADGAGSSFHSQIGSAIACETILEHAARFLEAHQLAELQIDDVLLWCDDLRTRIQRQANEKNCPTREFATTLSTAIIGADSAVFFQVGDGAIVLGNDVACGVVFWPQSGEYVNSTNFLTSDEYHKQLEFISVRGRFSKLALMTDGLERLALRFDTRTPHVPFFDPLFRAVQATGDVDDLNAGLRKFLGSDSIQHRSDDDKTLVLATRCADGSA